MRDLALIAAGIIGGGTAIVHGVLVQRLMVKRLAGIADLPPILLNLITLLLHFSTVVWFAGGVALIAVTRCDSAGARLAVGILVGGAYAYGALGNAWATRGKHPGWVLMAIAVALIAYGVA